MPKFILDRSKITKKIMEILPEDERFSISTAMNLWWINKRPSGGLGLTTIGNDAFLKADIEYYEIDAGLDKSLWNNNTVRLLLDRKMTCPYYVQKSKMFSYIIVNVFDSRIAMMAKLYGGLMRLLEIMDDRPNR